MKRFFHLLGQQIKSTVWRAWRRLLQNAKPFTVLKVLPGYPLHWRVKSCKLFSELELKNHGSYPWRRILKNSGAPTLLAPKRLRKKYCGRIGSNTNFVIHASPSPKPEEQINKEFADLLSASEQRFFTGKFFEPFAQQVDLKSAIITSRMRQGNEDRPVDHLIAIFPSQD